MTLSRTKIVGQFLDKKYTKNELASWDIFQKDYPEINNVQFRYGIRAWKKTHSYDLKAMLWFNEVRYKSVTKQIREYLDQYRKNNEPADWEEFHDEYPGIAHESFYHGCDSWHNLHKEDPAAMEWFDTTRVGGPSITEQIRRYFNRQCAAGDAASWEVFHKEYPKINNEQFRSAKKSWKKVHLEDPKAMLWYNEVRYKSGERQVREFLNQCSSNNEPADWEEFHDEYPGITHKTFLEGSYRWRDLHKEDPVAMEWFDTNRVGGPSDAEQVRRYLDWQCATGDVASWEVFHKIYQEIREGAFYSGVYSWRDLHSDKPAYMRWFANIRLGGISDNEQVRRFLDWQCAAGDIALWEHFKLKSKTFNHHSFFNGVLSWHNLHQRDPAAMEWFDTIRKGGLSGCEQVRRYIDWQYAASDVASWAHFQLKYKTKDQLKYEKINHRIFCSGISSWYNLHTDDPAAIQWYNTIRLAGIRHVEPSNNNRIIAWLDQQYSSRTPAWRDLFLEDNPDISTISFRAGKKMWMKNHANDQNALDWIEKFTTVNTYPAGIGKKFERAVISDFSRAMKLKNINLYYDTKSIETLGQLRGKNLKGARRVEMRFFAQDLLSAQSKIGPSLKNFLSTTQRPQMAIDLTLGGAYGKKISFYANATTSLLVVNPYGNKFQRSLESHIQVLSLHDFIGPQWFNLDKNSQEEIMKDLDVAQSALYNGPDSKAWQNLKTLEEAKWGMVVNKLKTDGSQAEFQTRVADDIATQLRQGKMPTELTAYSESARAAGHKEHAGEVEKLAQFAVAIARVKQVPPIDPAHLAEAREFAKVLQAARDADAAQEKEQEKKCIDPERLAEARKFAKVLQAARDADAAREKKTEMKGTDAARLAEAREFACAIQEARDADNARPDRGKNPHAGQEKDEGRNFY